MVHFDAYESTTCPILLRNCQLSGLTPVRLRLYQIVSTHLNQFQIGFLINFCECKFLDAVYELQGKKVCGRKGVKVELARDSQRKRKRFATFYHPLLTKKLSCDEIFIDSVQIKKYKPGDVS